MSSFTLGDILKSTNLLNVITITGILFICDKVLSKGNANQFFETMDQLTTPKPHMSDMGLNNGTAGYTPDYMGHPK